MKKIINLLLVMLLIIPVNILAYSDYVYLGGDNVGIKLKSKGVLIVGFYDVDNLDLNKKGINIGDKIVRINDKEVNSIKEFSDLINSNKGNVKIDFETFNKTKTLNIKIPFINNNYRTGLYVKDSITGVGTLTYVDPNTKIFGALGHEIIDSRSHKIFDINYGNLYDSTVTNIIPSDYGRPGEKNALINDLKLGVIKENTNKGIFGLYDNKLDGKKLYKVGKPNEIKLGKAYFLTVLNDKNINKYEINIIKKNNLEKSKNILFEITDKDLLNSTNGIIQGMSGSPIIQDDKIIGAVTHVIVDNPHKGYGIFITNMLEEGEN